MELHQLRYFIRAAEMLHFTRAAESLYVSQPTLSSHIQQLEKELGCPLFDRIGRRVRLTEAGQLLLDHARRAIREVDMSKEAVAELLGLRRGSLRLGTTQVFSQYLVPASLAAFIATYPEIHIEVHWVTSSPEVERRVLSGDLDFGLCFLPPESADIQYETLFSDEVVLVVSKKHPLAAHKTVSITDLGRLPLALLSAGLSTRRLLDLQFAKSNFSPKILLEMNDIPALLTVVASGNAGTMVSSRLVVNRPDLRSITIKEGIRRNAGIIIRKERHLSAAARAFLDLLKIHCRREKI